MKKYNFVCVQTIFNDRMDTKKLRQKILDLAIHGKLVPQDPNDEPASVLLERIRAEKERLIAEGKIKRSKKSATSDTSHYENVPFEVPEGWTKCCLYDIVSADCTLGYGIVQPMDDINDGVPVVRPVDLTTQIIRNNGLKRIDPTISEAYQRTILKGGEILFCVRASVGKLGIASPELKGANVTRGISPIRFDYESLTKYVFYHLQSFFSQNEIKHYSRGATLQQINVEDLKKLSIALPPLDEQKRIVNELEQWLQVCDIIEDSETKLMDSLSIIKNKILDLAIHGKLVPQDPNDEPASELLNRINPKAVASCDNPHYGKVPSSWVISTVGEVFTINPKTHAEDDTEAAFVPMTCVADGYSNTFEYECRKWGDIKKGFVHFQENDVAVAKISPCLENRKSVVFHDLPNGIGAGTTELNVFRCAEVLPEYALFYFKSKMFIGSCAGTYNGVVGQQRVAKSFIQELPIGIPPYNEQLRIVSKVNDLFSHLDMIEKSLQA